MIHVRSLSALHLSGAYVTIGTFDGVHLGHRHLIDGMAREAHAAGLPAVVITFFPHPAAVLRGLSGPLYLTPVEERAGLLGEAGADQVATLRFDRDLAALPAEAFMRLVSAATGLRRLYAGSDFALGRNREGNLAALRAFGTELGYEVNVTQPLEWQDGVISSSRVRVLLTDGQVEDAARLLGRRYAIQGVVVHGDGRGRGLGFPTANLQIWDEQIVPRNGVYAAWGVVDGQTLPAVVNIGVRPTFEAGAVAARIEAHLLNTSADLYGKLLRVEFVRFLRPERRFESIQALREQIDFDSRSAAEVLSHAE